MRLPWPNNFSALLSHTDWSTLKNHALYARAKQHADLAAAVDVVEALSDTSILDSIVDNLRREDTIILAPSLNVGTNKNGLSLGYAAWLGKQLEIPVCKTIFQAYRPKKDRLGFWQRIVYPSVFEGEIASGQDFVLVDDVYTFGGTTAESTFVY